MLASSAVRTDKEGSQKLQFKATKGGNLPWLHEWLCPKIWPWWNTCIPSGECQDIKCRLPCCWWIEEQIYRCGLALSTQISFISSCSALDLGHKNAPLSVTSGCYHYVDTVHLPFIVSGREKWKKKNPYPEVDMKIWSNSKVKKDCRLSQQSRFFAIRTLKAL